jgi:hypothetical protein
MISIWSFGFWYRYGNQKQANAALIKAF